jgi:hypothetical protein
MKPEFSELVKREIIADQVDAHHYGHQPTFQMPEAERSPMLTRKC